MQETRHPQWLLIIVFTSLGLLALGMIAYLTTGPADQAADQYSHAPLYRDRTLPGDTPESIYLNRDQWKSIDGLKLCYRGLEGGFLLIDVIITDLDPEFAYPHRIVVADAEKGFRLVNRGFSLDYARSARIRLKLTDPASR